MGQKSGNPRLVALVKWKHGLQPVPGGCYFEFDPYTNQGVGTLLASSGASLACASIGWIPKVLPFGRNTSVAFFGGLAGSKATPQGRQR